MPTRKYGIDHSGGKNHMDTKLNLIYLQQGAITDEPVLGPAQRVVTNLDLLDFKPGNIFGDFDDMLAFFAKVGERVTLERCPSCSGVRDPVKIGARHGLTSPHECLLD